MNLDKSLAIALSLVIVLLVGSVPARAATFTVDTTADNAAATTCDDAMPNDCSLRGAVSRANATAGHDDIIVPAGTYGLSVASPCTFRAARGENFSGSTVALCINSDVSLSGADDETTIIQGNDADRVIAISVSTTVSISGVTIRGGGGTPFGFAIGGGGGILNHGTLTLSDSIITNNQAPGGGAGLFNYGTLSVVRTHVRSNIVSGLPPGGGIANSSDAGAGILKIVNSTLSENSAVTGGGLSTSGDAVITGSTISGNTAVTGLGGGVFNSSFSTLTMINTTVSGNAADGGGGIANNATGSRAVRLLNVTVVDNSARNGGGITVGGTDTVALSNTILARNTVSSVGPDCLASVPQRLLSEGYNLIQNTANCNIGGDTTGNITGQDPQLGFLVDNGGRTKTHALGVGSPAIDAGTPDAPGSGGVVCAVADQRGFLRPLGTACDVGAFERTGTFSLAAILPTQGGNTGSVAALVSGDGIASGATVKLTRTGQADIVGNPVQVDVGGSAIAATFDLIGRPIGAWDVVVTNPDSTGQTLTGGFTIEEGRAPQLWVQPIGRSTFRRSRIHPNILTIFYGNRGNVDAVGVPLSIFIPSGYELSVFFEITPPPVQAGQVATDWSQVPLAVFTNPLEDSTSVSLLLPLVPAGFTGILRIAITASAAAQDGTVLVALGDAFFDPGIDPQVIATAVAGAQAYAQRNLGVTIPPALVPDLEQYAANQLQSVVASGRQAFINILGSRPQIYSLAQLAIDLAQYGAARTMASAASPTEVQPSSSWLTSTMHMLASFLSHLGPSAAEAADPCAGRILGEGESCSDRPTPTPPPTNPKPGGGGLTPAECRDQPNHSVSSDGSTCIPNPGSGCGIIASPFSTDPRCARYPIRPVFSNDPNDKVGPLGVATARFLVSTTALNYTVFFENLETATAAAQVVEVTDQLDVQAVNLDTFSLGPISFGNITLTPLPGTSQFTGGVDLRPAQNLIVTVNASLDKSSGLLTWLFTSIDPNTGQLTDDPLAGFLPPNINPPEGEGSVSFSIQFKPGLATGTALCNGASIVFDENDPIVTSQWCNTIDDTSPSSQVLPLAAPQPSPTFTVQWSGTDVGAGIADYTIFVSQDGGPFTAFLTDTPDTSATFTGTVGSSYAFYSVARDAVGNIEAMPGSPDTQTTVGDPGSHDLAVTDITVPPMVTLTENRAERTKQVKVQIQNRSPHTETIPDAAVLANLVTLTVQSLGSCPAPTPTLHVGAPQKKLPVTLKPKQKLQVVFDVTFDCANDPANSTPRDPGHEDYSLSARVHHLALGAPDAHPADDVCPRQVSPPGVVDSFPDGKIIDKGCGERKADKTFGAPVLVDIVVRP